MSKRINIAFLLFLLIFSSIAISAASTDYISSSNNNFWSPPEIVGPLNLLDFERGPDGTIHLIGTKDCCSFQLHYTQRDLAGNWSTPEIVDNDIDTFRSSWEADLAIGTDGIVHVIWLDNPDGQHDVQYSQRDLVGNWTSPITISETDHDDAGISLFLDSTDQLHASWFSYGPPGLFTRYQVGGNWGDIQRVDGNQIPEDPIVLMDSQQNIHFFWFNTDSQNRSVYYRKQFANNSFGLVTPISDPPTSAPFLHERLFASLDNQDLVVTWSYQEGVDKNIYFTEFTDGSWSSPAKLNTTNARFFPVFIGSTSNNIYLISGEEDTDVYTLHFRPSGGTWTSEPMVFLDSIDDDKIVAHVSPDNTLHLLWGNPIQYRTRQNLDNWSAIEPINSEFGLEKELIKQQGSSLYLAWRDRIQYTSSFSFGILDTAGPFKGYIPAVYK